MHTNIEHRRIARTSLSQLHFMFGQLFFLINHFSKFELTHTVPAITDIYTSCLCDESVTTRTFLTKCSIFNPPSSYVVTRDLILYGTVRYTLKPVRMTTNKNIK